MAQQPTGMLSPYRVLDLTDEKGLLCGKLLGDLGADVIKIERPGGDLARSIGPFYHDEPDPEKSLFWFAFNTSKRGITLDIETAEGQEVFKKLVKRADFVIESFPPGYLDRLGLGYSALEQLNPGVVMVSITPFGQSGPHKDYKASGMVAWALGGYMYPFGDADRPPVQISHHSHAYLHAAAEGAVGAMMALHHRAATGEGQQVDVSLQEAVAICAEGPTGLWDMMGLVLQREGAYLRGGRRVRVLWPCRDGHVIWVYWTGLSANWTLPLLRWMESEGMADDFLRSVNWAELDWTTATPELVDRIEEPTMRFFMAHTKAELYQGALDNRVQLYPVADISDTLADVQLASRGFWVGVEHPELGTTIAYPGAFVQASEAPVRVWRRAPLIGEHNSELYEQELGIPHDEMVALMRSKVI